MAKWLTPLALLLFVALVMALRHRSAEPEPTVGTSSAKPALAPPPAPALPAPRRASHADEIFNGPRKPMAETPVTKQIPPACRQLWGSLRTADLNQLFKEGIAPPVFPDASGCAQVPRALAVFHQHYADSCGSLPENMAGRDPMKDPAGAVGECHMAFLEYRAQLTDWETAKTPLSAIRDPKVLADKLVARFERDPGQAAKVADRLLAVDPTLYPAAKAAALSRFLDAERSGEGNAVEAKWDAAQAALTRAEGMKSGDKPELAEMGALMAVVRTHDPDIVRQKAEAISAALPGSGVGPYYLAWAEHKAGNDDLAVAHLQEALKREPGNARYQRTLGALTESGDKGGADGKGGSPFQSSLNFSLNLAGPAARHP